MKVNRSQASTLRKALEFWTRSGFLDGPAAARLSSSIEENPFDWKRLAKYSFWVSLICIVIAVASVLADEHLMQLLRKFFDAPYFVKFGAFTVLAAIFYGFGYTRRLAHPHKTYSNEAILFLGVLSTAAAIYQFGQMVDTGSGHFSILLLLSFVVYGVLGFCFESNLIWLFALLSLGGWMGTETGYASGWGAYYLGMNYPLRFVLFGAALTAAALGLEKNLKFGMFFRTTLAVGLLYLFVALWLLSIFGNYGDVTVWRNAGQRELFHWSLLFALVACGAIYHGLRFDNGMTKGFGITFLFINLYTRYFEYFWNGIHKAIFFAVLAMSFWYLGSRAERIWNLGGRAE